MPSFTLHVACITALVASAPACKKPSDRGEAANTTAGSAVTGSTPGKNRSGKVSVLYAGSLVSLMENDLGPAFAKSTGLRYEGEGKGSTALANMIRDKLRQPDVFVSASAKVNELLVDDAGGRQVAWYAVVFGNEMVIAHSPKSALAPKFEEVKVGKLAFYEPLLTEGIKLGRTDPKLDPKGFRTLMMFDLAATFYEKPDLTKQILGEAENPEQTFPEEQLVARLECSTCVYTLPRAVTRRAHRSNSSSGRTRFRCSTRRTPASCRRAPCSRQRSMRCGGARLASA